MKLDYLKCIRKYLSETRENLGVAGFSIASTYNPRCIIGRAKGCALITDVNSAYIINNFSSVDELFVTVFNSNVARLVNTEYLINDLSKYPLSLEKLSVPKLYSLLNEEQRYFYETILKSDIQSFYDEKEEVLLGFSESGCGYVYAPSLKSTKCR